MKKFLVTSLVVLSFAVSFCCKRESAVSYKIKETPDLLAQINGQPLYEKDLDVKSQTNLYENKKQIVDNYVRDKALNDYMKKKGLDRNQVFEKEIKSKVKNPSEKEIKAFYDARGIKQPYEQVKPQIENALKSQETREKQNEFFNGLMKGNQIVYYFTRPKVSITLGENEITRGPKDAPMLFVEYTDFQCPFCQRSQAVVEEITKKYGTKMLHVFRNFPLPMHNEARGAANAALCANEQNMFWKYHEVVFERQGQINPDNLLKWADELKLDKDKFKKCVDAKTYDKMIQRDIDSGTAAGVSATPVFFINGITISGAQPVTAFEEIIKEQLASVAKK